MGKFLDKILSKDVDCCMGRNVQKCPQPAKLMVSQSKFEFYVRQKRPQEFSVLQHSEGRTPKRFDMEYCKEERNSG